MKFLVVFLRVLSSPTIATSSFSNSMIILSDLFASTSWLLKITPETNLYESIWPVFMSFTLMVWIHNVRDMQYFFARCLRPSAMCLCTHKKQARME